MRLLAHATLADELADVEVRRSFMHSFQDKAFGLLFSFHGISAGVVLMSYWRPERKSMDDRAR